MNFKNYVIIFCLLGASVFAQEEPYLKVSYSMLAQSDITQISNDCHLYFNNSESIYEEIYIYGDESATNYVYRKYDDDVLNLYFEEDRKYVVLDEIRDLEWMLDAEKKEINGRLCSKAKVSFRGRDYVAWYDETIPTVAGPWKFKNLPGLIFEISDNKNIFIKLMSIQSNVIFDKSKIFSKKSKKITLKEYLKIKDEEFQLFISKLKANAERNVTFEKIVIEKDTDMELEFEWED